MELSLVSLARAVLPAAVRARIRAQWLGGPPPVGRVNLGSLRRLEPISRDFGFDRGVPVDRFYIEQFLEDQREQIRGRVLEVADNTYTCRFGGERVSCSDVLDIHPTEFSTLVGDLGTGEGIPTAAYDCIVLTQVLLLVYDIKAAIVHSYEALRPGGVLLATLPGITPLCRDHQGRWHDCWRVTAHSARRLFAEVFGDENVLVRTYGNVLTAVAFLQGLAVEDLHASELAHHDPAYEVTVAVRARRAE
jgi:hypothetical protein